MFDFIDKDLLFVFFDGMIPIFISTIIIIGPIIILLCFLSLIIDKRDDKIIDRQIRRNKKNKENIYE